MRKMTVHITESQAKRIEARQDDGRADNRSEAMRQELRQTNDKSPRRKVIDVSANTLGTVGIVMLGFTFFYPGPIRALSLVPLIGSIFLYSIGYLIDEQIVSPAIIGGKA